MAPPFGVLSHAFKIPGFGAEPHVGGVLHVVTAPQITTKTYANHDLCAETSAPDINRGIPFGDNLVRNIYSGLDSSRDCLSVR
jgi:hypothetical protein